MEPSSFRLTASLRSAIRRKTSRLIRRPLGGASQKENLSAEGGKKMKYRVHRFVIKMTSEQSKLEQFLNSLEGEVVAIIPNVTWVPKTQVDFLRSTAKVTL